MVYAQVAAGEAALDLAMGDEVRYSFVLNDLSLTIPNDVWLTRIVVVAGRRRGRRRSDLRPGQPRDRDSHLHRHRRTSTTTSRRGCPH